jgi:hypothetical protein
MCQTSPLAAPNAGWASMLWNKRAALNVTAETPKVSCGAESPGAALTNMRCIKMLHPGGQPEMPGVAASISNYK